MNQLKKFWNDEAGLETVEYAIILGLIVAGTIGLVIWIGNWVNDSFQDAVDTLNDSTPGSPS